MTEPSRSEPASELGAARHARAAGGGSRLDTGVVVYDYRHGTGGVVQPGDEISVWYDLWLIDSESQDGKVIEGNFDHKPTTFTVGAGRVLRGIDNGVRGMRVAGYRLLVIPPEQAFGERGSGTRVPPDSTLAVNVYVIDIVTPA